MHVVGLLIVALAIAAAIWFYQKDNQGHISNTPATRIEQSASHSRALDLLEERYARGDISRKEFLEKKRDLEK